MSTVMPAFNTIVHFLIIYKYLLLFILVLAEGPTATVAGGFVASLGYINIVTVILLCFLGNFIADMIYYSLGRFGRHMTIERYKEKFHLNQEKLTALKKYSDKSGWQTIVISKFVPLLAIPTLIMAGATHTSLKKFILWISLAGIANSLLFSFLGYFFGRSYVYFIQASLKDIHAELPLVIILIVLLLYFSYRKIISIFIS